MRVLIYVPLLNSNNLKLVDCLCSLLKEEKHAFYIITKEQVKVQHNEEYILSRNHHNVDILKKKFGAEYITLLLSDLSIKPLKSDTLFIEHNSLVVEKIISSLQADNFFLIEQNHNVKIENDISSFQSLRPYSFVINKEKVSITFEKKKIELNLKECKTNFLKFVKNISTHEIEKKSQIAVQDYRKKYKHVIVKEITQKQTNKQKHLLPINLSKGEVESIQDNQVLLDDFVSIRGWIDWSNSELKAMIVKVNDKAYKIYPNLIRGDLIEEMKNYNILGFDERISLDGFGSRLKIEIYLMNQEGKEFRWKKYFLWCNHSVPKIYSNPILSGKIKVDSLGKQFECSGNIQIENINEYNLEFWQKGAKLYEEFLEEGAKDFKCLLPSSYEPNYPIFVWIHFPDGRKCFWNKLEFKQVQLSNSIKIIEPSFGQVIENGKLNIKVDSNETVMLSINGKIIQNNIENNFQVDVDVSSYPNQLFIEVCGSSNYSSVFCWNHKESIDFKNDNFCINMPNKSVLEKEVCKKSSSPKQVLLIRQNEAPTDELYVLASINELKKKYDINVEIVNLDDEVKPEKYKKLLKGCHVIISRYITSDWITLLTKHKNVIEKIYYLMDDDVGGAVDSIWMPGGYRQRMIKVSNGEFQSLLALSDRFISTSKFLQNRYFSEKTNLLEPPYLNQRTDLSHLDKNSIIISYHATQVHRDDLLFISDALKYIHDKYHNVEIQIVMGNYAPSQLKNLERVHLVQGMPWDEYKLFMKKCTSHISLAPLLDTAYNRGKSIIKLFDISRLGAMGIYTNTFPYNEVIDNGKNGILLENDSLIWQSTLSYLIENPILIKKIAWQAQDDAVKIGNMSKLNKYWIKELELNQ